MGKRIFVLPFSKKERERGMAESDEVRVNLKAERARVWVVTVCERGGGGKGQEASWVGRGGREEVC